MLDITEFDSHELLALARRDVDKGQLADALYKVKAGLAKDQYPSELLALAGNIYAQLGLFERAKGYLSNYVDKHPDSITEKFRLGMVYLDTNETSTALEIWTGLLQVAPTHPPSLYYSAIASLRLDQLGEAQRHIDVLLKSAEEDNLYYEKGQALLASINTSSNPDQENITALPLDIRSEYGAN
jgi:tetratricopeptide (TPR) repeat protein